MGSIPNLSFEETMLSRYGSVYVPNDCMRGETCHVHFFFHGTRPAGNPNRQNRQLAQTTQEEPQEGPLHKTLINNMAAANRVIVFYPADRYNWNNFNTLGDEEYMG